MNNEGEIIGIITEKDCLRVIYDEKYHNLFPNQGKVTNYMSKKVVDVELNTPPLVPLIVGVGSMKGIVRIDFIIN